MHELLFAAGIFKRQCESVLWKLWSEHASLSGGRNLWFLHHIRHRRPAGSKMSASDAGMWSGGPADVTDSLLSHVPLYVSPDRSRCAGAGRRTDQNSDGGGKSGGADGGWMRMGISEQKKKAFVALTFEGVEDSFELY